MIVCRKSQGQDRRFIFHEALIYLFKEPFITKILSSVTYTSVLRAGGWRLSSQWLADVTGAYRLLLWSINTL